MRREQEPETLALESFKTKVQEIGRLLIEIQELDDEVFDALYSNYILEPVEIWKVMGNTRKSQFFQAFIGSTTDWENSPDLDLPDGLIEKFVDDVVLPGLRNKLVELKRIEK